MTEPFDTKDPSGRFLLTILAGVADLERSNILERSRIGMERKAVSGKWLGGTPCLGYYVNDDKELAINDVINEDLGYSEAEVVRLVFSEFLRDGATTLTVASKFNSNNVPNSYCFRPNTVKSHSGLAKYWKYTTILNVLNNRAYIGEFQYGKRGKNPISYTIPAIITKEQFYMAQDKLKRNKLFSSRNRKHTYLLTGKIYCGCCGSRYTSYKKHYYNGKNIEYYRCYRNSNFIKELRCNNANINGNNLENTIWNICLNILNDFDENKLPFQKQNNNSSNKQELIKEKIASLNDEKIKKIEQRKSLATLYMNNLLSYDEVGEELERKAKEIASINQEIYNLESEFSIANTESNVNLVKVLSVCKNLISNSIINREIQKEIIGAIIDKVIVNKIKNTKIGTVTIYFNFDKEVMKLENIKL